MRGVGGILKRGPKGPSKYTQGFIEGQAEALLIYAETSEKLGVPFSLQRFSALSRTPIQYFSQFADEKSIYYNEKFHEAYRIFKSWQESNVSENALLGKYDSGFAWRFGKNVFGWRDEQHLKGEGFESNQIVQVYLPASNNILEAPRRSSDIIPSE